MLRAGSRECKTQFLQIPQFSFLEQSIILATVCETTGVDGLVRREGSAHSRRDLPAKSASEPTLPLDQILHECTVEVHARVDGDVVDVRLGALPAIKLLELGKRFQVIAAHAARVHGE